MKRLIFLTCVLISLSAHSQDFEKLRKEQRAKDSISQISAGNSFNAETSLPTYLNNFIGRDYNKAMPGLQMFLQNELSMSSVDVMSGMENGWLKITYTPQISSSREQEFIKVMAKMDNKGLIQQMQIMGDWDLLVSIYCSYWPTKLDFKNVKKGELVSVYYLREKITLSSISTSSQGVIVVKKI